MVFGITATSNPSRSITSPFSLIFYCVAPGVLSFHLIYTISMILREAYLRWSSWSFYDDGSGFFSAQKRNGVSDDMPLEISTWVTDNKVVRSNHAPGSGDILLGEYNVKIDDD